MIGVLVSCNAALHWSCTFHFNKGIYLKTLKIYMCVLGCPSPGVMTVNHETCLCFFSVIKFTRFMRLRLISVIWGVSGVCRKAVDNDVSTLFHRLVSDGRADSELAITGPSKPWTNWLHGHARLWMVQWHAPHWTHPPGWWMPNISNMCVCVCVCVCIHI
jgi:hypothetical protein